jgi:hypothetical protein
MLNAQYEKESEIPDHLKTEYKKSENGTWVLDGFVPKSKLSEFRENNRALAKEREELQSQLLRFKDIDPEKYADSVQKLQELENRRLEEAGEWKVLKANLEQQYTDQLKSEKERAKQIQEGWNKERIANQVAMTVTKFAVPGEGNMKYIQNDIQQVASIDPDTGDIVFLNDKGLKIMNEAGDAPLTMDEYLTKQYIPKSSLFKRSEGSGAPGSYDVPLVSAGQVSVDSINGKELPGGMIDDLASGKIKAV